ncbi:MAG TPA: ATP-binding protein [Chitinophagaceae bacterium]|nr:ATP-binding protein [Chitinophagaceae bacterium]
MQLDSEEVVIVFVAGIAVFLVLSGIVIYILFFYQRKRFQHQRQLIELQKQFNETLLTSQIEIQEHDFNVISREIHDNVGQILSLAKIQLNIISQSENIDRNMINDVKENIAKAMADLRDIAKGLNSERVQISNLYETIHQEVDRISRGGFIKGTTSLLGDEKELQQQKKLILFRIVQESLQNILKHSEATEFCIKVHYGDNAVEINITDNGKGFNLKGASIETSGMGLSNIQNRSLLIGGTAAIETALGAGTTVSINIPYD